MLVRTDEKDRLENFKKLIGGLKAFSREIEKNKGCPTFLEGRLSNVDIALMPW